MEQMGQMGQMTHSEAVNQMAAERYLLGELPEELRDAFEEHMFDCPECAFDIRAGVALIDEAKLQLPGLTAASPESSPRPAPQKRSRFGWWGSLFATPAFAGPVFATLLLVIGYQNLVTYPALRSEATEPRLLPAVALHGGTRGSAPVVVANRKDGVLLQIDLPGDAGQAVYSSFTVDLYNPQGKLAWTHNFSSAAGAEDGGTLSVAIPGASLETGAYALAVSGVGASGQRSELQRNHFQIQIHP
jgi:anti-sigma factor RsiW